MNVPYLKNQNQNSLLVKRQTDNTTLGAKRPSGYAKRRTVIVLTVLFTTIVRKLSTKINKKNP